MNLRVRALDFNYEDDGVTVKDISARFEMTGEEGTFFNGAIKITKEQYETSESFTDLAVVVKQKLKEEIASL